MMVIWLCFSITDKFMDVNNVVSAWKGNVVTVFDSDVVWKNDMDFEIDKSVWE